MMVVVSWVHPGEGRDHLICRWCGGDDGGEGIDHLIGGGG